MPNECAPTMQTPLRRLRNAPSRARAVAREIRTIANATAAALRDAWLVARRVRNTRVTKSTASGTAVINAARSWAISDVELYLAHLLSKAGMTVYVLFDDGALEHWDGAQSHRLRYYSPYRGRWFIRASHVVRKQLVWWAYSNKRMHMLNYSTFLDPTAVDFTPLASDAGYARSSTKRFFETGEVPTEGEQGEYYRMSLRNCAVSRAVALRALERLKPDLYITSHGIYSVWGPAYRAMREAGIPIVVWQVSGATAGRVRLIDRQDQVLAQTADWRSFDAQTPTTEDLVTQGRALLDARVRHATQDTREYFEGRVQPAALERYRRDPERTTFALFPNVVWDGDVPERNIMFDDVVEWCLFTIDVIRNTSHRLFVRFHPSEVTRLKGSVRLLDVVRDRIRDVDRIPNVTLIDSDEPLDTYAFAQECVDIGLIYDGTLCLELTHLGIPVIACTNGNFTPESIVFKPSSQSEFQRWLEEPANVTAQFKAERHDRSAVTAKFAHWLFRESLMAFTPLDAPYPAHFDYRLVRADQPLSPDEARILLRLLQPLDADG